MKHVENARHSSKGFKVFGLSASGRPTSLVIDGATPDAARKAFLARVAAGTIVTKIKRVRA